jgi:hypothetical protein
VVAAIAPSGGAVPQNNPRVKYYHLPSAASH